MPRRKFMKMVWVAIISVSVLELSAVIIAFLTSGGRKSLATGASGLKMLGRVEEFGNDTVSAFRSNRLYLVRMEDGGFLAMSLHCTHLGCAVSWNKDKREFDCPCHASSFSLRGEVISPPAPRALDLYPIRIEGGMVKADLSHPVKRKKFDPSQLTYA
ncbi:MAG TPA: Rieske (2Fe-2S) protein [Bacteroidales bacterium]|nr:Rieske (2Fe-2S) protein [Bacteroidales bacterium]